MTAANDPQALLYDPNWLTKNSECTGSKEPYDHRERSAEAQKLPAGMVDVRAEIENCRERDKQAEDQYRPLGCPPQPIDNGLDADGIADPARELRS